MPGTKTTSICHAPDFKTIRFVTVADVIANIPQPEGTNCSAYDRVHFQAIQSGGALATIQMFVWSDAASKFIPNDPTGSFVLGALETSRIVNVDSQIVFFAVTVIPGGESVTLSVAGINTRIMAH